VSAFDRIPRELRAQPGPGWVVWRWEGEKKPPYSPNDPSRHASSTNSETWGTFEQSVSLVKLGVADGIGFALASPYVGVDLDEELSETERYAIMLALGSYAEVSVSGCGHHVILKANLNGRGRHPQGFGVFQTGRFFYCSGEHVTGTPETIEERQDQLEAVLDEYLPASETRVIDSPRPQPVGLDDQELLEIGRALLGDKFQALWDGAWSGRYETQSQADQALCNHLAWLTGRDASRIERMFSSSGLHRAKWDRQDEDGHFDYRELTIGKAIEGCAEVYQPRRPERSRGSDSVDSVASKTVHSGAASPNGVTESGVKDSVTPDDAAPLVDEEPRSESEPDSDPDSADRPFALPIKEFIKLEREQREPILADADGRTVVGLLSLTLLGALGGHGKTTWAIDLFLHMAAGVDFAPFTIPEPVSVLVIENEGPEQLFADKLAARLEHFPHELKARLDVCTFDWGGFSLADETHRERLICEIAERGYDLIFGDPLDSLGIEGVGSPEDTRKFLALMKETGLNKTVAWWLNTHPRKEETKEALNEISGAWGGKPDSVFLMRMLDDDRTQLRQPKLRWARRGKGPTLLFAFDADTEAFSFIGEQSEEERDYLAEVRGLLADGVWRIVKEIASPHAAGGIAANDKIVKKVLEEHPDVFESRTGEDAKSLGRKPQATVWQLRREDEAA
jgi:putative DNA primase/helicase